MPLVPALALGVTAARAHGLYAIDGVFNALGDTAGLQAECAHGRSLGFDGKCLIHPDQIEAANAAFSPDETEISWARSVVEAFADPANAGKGAIHNNNKKAEQQQQQKTKHKQTNR